jgi:hypothetical protein
LGDWSVAKLVVKSADLLLDWSADWSVDELVDWSEDWSTAMLVAKSENRSAD